MPALSFDDLIPQAATPQPGVQQTPTLSFDDLIPKQNPDDKGAFAAGVQGFNNMIPGGNRLAAAGAAAVNYPIAKMEGSPVSFSDLYQTARAEQEATDKAHPTAHTVGTIAGIVNSLPLFLASGGQNATPIIGDAANAVQKSNAALADWLGSGNLAARVGKGIAAGAASGGAYGAGNAPEDQVAEGAKQGAAAGALVGGALPVAGAALSPLVDAVKPFYESGREAIVGNFLKNQATGDLENIPANEIIPGSQPTLGQATGDYGILSLERGMRNANPLDFAPRESANNAARNEALNAIAGTPEDLAAAKAARAEQAGKLYPQAFQANKSLSSPMLNRILQTPAGKQALNDAATAMQNDMALMATPDKELAEQAALAGQPIKGGVGNGLNLRTWDYIKQSLDDQISAAQRAGENNTVRSLTNLKNGVLNELDRLDTTATLPAGRDETGTFTAEQPNPEGGLYKQARGEYAAASKPINQMEQLQDIKNKAMIPIPDPQTGYDYISQAKLSRLFDTSKDDLQKVLTPEQFGTLQSIVSDLDRASSSNAPNLRAAGSDTVQNLTTKNLASNILGKNIGESLLVQTAMRPLSWIYQLPEQKMRDVLTQALLNPTYAKQILAQSSQKTLPPILSAIGGGAAGEAQNPSIPKVASGSIGDQNIQELQRLKGQMNPVSAKSPANAIPDISKFAQAESGNNPNAKNPNSTASGLMQFTNRTWADMVSKYGQQTGITLRDKNNPQAQATMAALYAKDNIAYLGNTLGRIPTKGELYMAHVLGPAGATKLIKAQGSNREAITLFPRQVTDANRSIFFAGRQPRTVDAVYQLLAGKVA